MLWDTRSSGLSQKRDRLSERIWQAGGLYCPPLIPARIRRNPGNSRNSRGIKFGRGATAKSIVGVCRQSIWVWSTTPNPALSQPPSSTTPTPRCHLVNVTSAHHHLQSSPAALNDHSMLQPSKNKTTSPLKNEATTPHHRMNEHPPGATSPTATWQPDDERQCCRSSSFTPAKSCPLPYLF